MNLHTTLNPSTTKINRNGRNVDAIISDWDDNITIEIGRTCLTIDKEDLIFRKQGENQITRYTLIEHDDLFNPGALTREEYEMFRSLMHIIEQHRVKCGKPLKVDVTVIENKEKTQ